jgi:hypothetical protein
MEVKILVDSQSIFIIVKESQIVRKYAPKTSVDYVIFKNYIPKLENCVEGLLATSSIFIFLIILIIC